MIAFVDPLDKWSFLKLSLEIGCLCHYLPIEVTSPDVLAVSSAPHSAAASDFAKP